MGTNWFCVQTHPKHEHIAAAGLRRHHGFEVFNPQMKICRPTRRGPVWFTESAFPNYIFARLNLEQDLDRVRYCFAVSKIVHFKSGYPVLQDTELEMLKSVFCQSELVVAAPQVSRGDTVRIVGGVFHELVAVVHEVKSGGQRVQALLEFLGRMTIVELDMSAISVEERRQPAWHPLSIAGAFDDLAQVTV